MSDYSLASKAAASARQAELPERLSVTVWHQTGFVPTILRQASLARLNSIQPLNLNSPRKKKTLMKNNVNPKHRRIGVVCKKLTLLCCLALAFTGCEKPAARPPDKSLVCAAMVQPMDKTRADGDASYLASVRFDHETDLSFKVGGIVDRIGPSVGTDWDEATPVKAGAVLAELKQGDFTNALNSARAHADLTSKTLERFRRLRTTDAISQQELDVTEADWRTAQAQLDQVEQNLRDSRLVAAKDGVVLARYVNSRVTVSPGQSALRFADTSLMSVELGLPDTLIGRLSPGKEIPVEFSGLEGLPPFEGRVTEVGVAASSEGRLFRVVIKVPNPDGLLRSGMTARIHIGDTPPVKPGTVCIPLSALVTLVSAGNSQAGGQTQLGVFVVQNGKAIKRAVETGDILNSSIQITEGLQAGEQVVTSGASFLYDGAPIDITADLAAK
jgi:RND family efflux transporter MFP subunit